MRFRTQAWSLRRIESATGVRRETAAGYLKADGISIRAPGAWGRRPPDSKPANEVIPDCGAELPKPPATASASEPFRELIEQALSRGRNAKAIWQDLVDDHGFRGGYQSVKRFIHKLPGSASVQQPCAVITTAPGEEAQVDYGEGPLVRDPSPAFVRLGGTPRVLILDNLREGILKPDIYDPAINPLYRDLLAHYQAIAMPCRIQDPDRTGKVESSVGHAQTTPLKGQRFEALPEAQAFWIDGRSTGRTHVSTAPPNVKSR